jgi:hypothetical protein
MPLLEPSSRKLYEADRVCSCGCFVRDCKFWGHVLKRLRTVQCDTLVDRYALTLQTFEEVFGSDVVPVDSSKSLRSLRIAATVVRSRLKVIHLLRDVRSWTVSRRDVDLRKRHYKLRDLYARFGASAWRPYLQRNSYSRFLLWYYGNRQIQRFLKGSSIQSLTVSYEELCLSQDQPFAELASFVGNEAMTAAVVLPASRSHVALGNAAVRLGRSTPVRYDTRWLHRAEWLGPSLVFPQIMRYNKAMVYRAQSHA